MIPQLERLSKESLREEFSKHYEEYYSTKLFQEEGFRRNHCKICGRYFWSLIDRDVCDDHVPYTFFKEKPEPVRYDEFWLKFAGFFKKRGHTIIKRYPVVSRWRPDLYFTIAGIQDFQRIENGAMNFEYPANPLVVPQVCLRFSDIQNVGVTGKHFTSWTMANQTAFNWPREGYWRDKTIELNYEFLTRILGVKKENLVYHEDVWAMGDFSEFGPSLEFFSNGLELGNNVFTQFESVNGRVRELKEKVVDVGWGFDRLLWFHSGFPTAYQVVFRDQLEKLAKGGMDLDDSLLRKFALFGGELDITEAGDVESKISEILSRIGVTKEQYEKRIRPVQSVYAILDHVRTLLFAINDGALPSNMGGGYNLRVLLRRALGFMERYGLDIDMDELARSEATSLRRMFPELLGSMDSFARVIKVEHGRYARSRENATRIVEGVLSKDKRIEQSQLRTLYESHGITPEFILDFAISKGIRLELPKNLYRGILEGEFIKKEKGTKIDFELPKLKATEKLYYRSATRSRSRIVFVHKNHLVLDGTPFYPESGGQLADHGTINDIRVRDVQKVGDVIVHVMEGEVSRMKGFEVGRSVEALVDAERRQRIAAHHTAAHLINASAREVLGRHVWQEGAEKDYDKARLDITHYERLTENEIVEIERGANRYLSEGIVVRTEEMERGKAESKYGFIIYQGHGVPAKRMMIVTISTKRGKLIDAEACGGLHATGEEGSIGMIKIISTDRIHDGVDRIEFVAGRAALDHFEREDAQLTRIAKELNVEKMKSFDAVVANRSAYSELHKRLDQYNDAIAGIVAAQFADKDVVELAVGKAPRELMRKLATAITGRNEKAVVLLMNLAGDVVCSCGEYSGKNALEFAKGRLSHRGFRGGGSERVAEGRVAS